MGFYGAVMAPDLKHPATGDLIVLADGEQLWRIGWPGAPVLVEPLGNEPSKRVQACDLIGMNNFWWI